MRASRRAHGAQRGLRAWPGGLGYSEAYFSRVIKGKNPLTHPFRRSARL